MAEDTFKNFIIGFVLFTLFGMLILSAVVSVGENYGMDTSQVVGGSLSLTKFNNSISGVEDTAKDFKTSFDRQSVWSALAGVVVEGIFGIAKDMITMILAPFDLLSDVLSDVIGVPSYVTSVLLGILIISIILSVWRLIKIGD